GLDPLMLDQAANLIGEQRFAMFRFATEPNCLFLMSHRLASSKSDALGCDLGGAISRSTIDSRDRFDQSNFELHSQTETELLKLVFDFVERFLPEVAVLEHFAFGLLRELTNGGDVGVVQAIGSANTELDFVHAHVEQLLEL